MSGEIQLSYQSGKTTYSLIRNRVGQIWNTISLAFEVYASGSYASYPVALTEQGASGFYTGNFPTQIAAGVYSVVAKNQPGGSALETDGTVGEGDLQWNGSVTLPLSDLATSGQIGTIAPIRAARGTMILNFPFKLVSAGDHVTPFTSGICSGQISRDGGAFGALQSGGAVAGYTEIGLGWYTVKGITSGDLLCNTAALNLFATGISGGTSDPRDFSLLLQRTSGQ